MEEPSGKARPAIRIVEIDSEGYRVYPVEGEPWDRALAEAVSLAARAAALAARRLGRPITSLQVNLAGQSLVVTIGRGRIVGLIFDEEGPAGAPSQAAGTAKASV